MRKFEIAKGFEELGINLPKRSTVGSAGYDIESAETIIIPSIFKVLLKNMVKYLFSDTKEEEYVLTKPILVKTGIKIYMEKDECVKIYNRSSNPLKKGLVLGNSVCIGDSDFVDNKDNDGHYQMMFWNFFPFDVTIKKGDKIAQAIFQKFLLTDDDNASGERKGGLGSTGE